MNRSKVYFLKRKVGKGYGFSVSFVLGQYNSQQSDIILCNHFFFWQSLLVIFVSSCTSKLISASEGSITTCLISNHIIIRIHVVVFILGWISYKLGVRRKAQRAPKSGRHCKKLSARRKWMMPNQSKFVQKGWAQSVNFKRRA